MLLDAVLLYGTIIGVSLLLWASYRIAGVVSQPPVQPPRFRDRFQRMWYCAETRRLYAYIWQHNVWYEVSYCGVGTYALAVASYGALRRFDGGPAEKIGKPLLAVLHGLWWMHNEELTERHTRETLTQLIHHYERTGQ